MDEPKCHQWMDMNKKMDRSVTVAQEDVHAESKVVQSGNLPAFTKPVPAAFDAALNCGYMTTINWFECLLENRQY